MRGGGFIHADGAEHFRELGLKIGQAGIGFVLTVSDLRQIEGESLLDLFLRHAQGLDLGRRLARQRARRRLEGEAASARLVVGTHRMSIGRFLGHTGIVGQIEIVGVEEIFLVEEFIFLRRRGRRRKLIAGRLEAEILFVQRDIVDSGEFIIRRLGQRSRSVFSLERKIVAEGEIIDFSRICFTGGFHRMRLRGKYSGRSRIRGEITARIMRIDRSRCVRSGLSLHRRGVTLFRLRVILRRAGLPVVESGFLVSGFFRFVGREGCRLFFLLFLFPRMGVGNRLFLRLIAEKQVFEFIFERQRRLCRFRDMILRGSLDGLDVPVAIRGGVRSPCLVMRFDSRLIDARIVVFRRGMGVMMRITRTGIIGIIELRHRLGAVGLDEFKRFWRFWRFRLRRGLGVIPLAALVA